MGTSKERAILFADLRGSTALYLKLGNAEAATVVTQSLSLLGQIVAKYGGRVVKTLGDGLMAVFGEAEPAVEVAVSMHDSLEHLAPITQHQAARHGAIRLKVAIAWGEMIEVDGDCFGDAVNVAARLESRTKEIGWPVIASRTTVDTAGAGIQTGKSVMLDLRGRNAPIEAVEIIGTDQPLPGLDSSGELPPEIREALAANANLDARLG